MQSVRRFEIKRFENGNVRRALDNVAAEEPLEIRLQYWFKNAPLTSGLALTMRTPGHDCELTAGYLLTEGIVRGRCQIVALRHIGADPSDEIVAELSQDVDVDAWRLVRNSFLGASCGICGKRTLQALSAEVPTHPGSARVINSELIESLPDLLCSRQEGFSHTGGLHAAALIDADGKVGASFEDIGRHNALDKLIGHELLEDRTPLTDALVFLSSRGSFELVQKAAMAGAPILATVGGPSSMAIEAAREYGITLIGFVRPGRFNIYSGDWRVSL